MLKQKLKNQRVIRMQMQQLEHGKDKDFSCEFFVTCNPVPMPTTATADMSMKSLLGMCICDGVS